MNKHLPGQKKQHDFQKKKRQMFWHPQARMDYKRD